MSTTAKLVDVARIAGVSPTTVSRVMNNTAPVNEQTRARVLAAIAELGYKSSTLAPLSANTERRTIALVISDIRNPFFPEIVRGVEDEAGTNGLAMVLCNTSEDPQREAQALNALAERAVDGIIVCASRIANEALIDLHEQTKIPLVLINRNLYHPSIPCVLIDFTNAAYRATQHLLRLNHVCIAYLAGNSISSPSLARRKGIEKALQEAHLALHPELCPASFPNVEGGFQAMSSLLALPREEQPTAVIAYNDIMALGALHAIRTNGLSVPDDISVVGCDGIPMAAHSNPPLTTIEQPKYHMGQLAMQMLRVAIEGHIPPSNGYTLLESPLIVRESTAPIRQ